MQVKTGVAQGSLVSPILYNWYVNSLVKQLTAEFDERNVFAYADDIAVLCLGVSDVRRVVTLIDQWSTVHAANVNRKKCGILPISKKDSPDERVAIDGVPVVGEYRYLGIPLDQSLALKHLVPLVTSRINKFNKRIGLIFHTVVGIKERFRLWQTYIRCAFDYFGPTIALCQQTKKFEALFSGSLKMALDLPHQTSSQASLLAVGHPSLEEIAAHHISKSVEKIQGRFNLVPRSLEESAKSFWTRP